MPGLVSQLPAPDQLQVLRDGVSQQSQTLGAITQTLGSLPAGDIQALVSRLGDLSLPDLGPLLAALPGNLGDLSQRLPSDPAALLGQLPGLLEQLSSTAGSDLLGKLAPALE